MTVRHEISLLWVNVRTEFLNTVNDTHFVLQDLQDRLLVLRDILHVLAKDEPGQRSQLLYVRYHAFNHRTTHGDVSLIL
jgi:hypothetical protein